jgi:hypothetical protein
MSLAAITQPALAAPAPVDTRPTFSLADYVIWDPGTSYICAAHGVDHGVYTHGCQPVAFSIASEIVPGASARPATPDAIPFDVYQECPFSADMAGPHQHHDFRWVV